jgi:hypothetical protein
MWLEVTLARALSTVQSCILNRLYMSYGDVWEGVAMIWVPSLPSICPLHKGRMMMMHGARTSGTCTPFTRVSHLPFSVASRNRVCVRRCSSVVLTPPELPSHPLPRMQSFVHQSYRGYMFGFHCFRRPTLDIHDVVCGKASTRVCTPHCVGNSQRWTAKCGKR